MNKSCGRGETPRGVKNLAFQDEKDGERRRRSEPHNDNAPASIPRSRKRRAPAPEVGSALKSVYDRTMLEDIPPEMLDLLGKLG